MCLHHPCRNGFKTSFVKIYYRIYN
jgi:hypothetical protein